MSLEMSDVGTGHISYADLTLCQTCSFADAPTSTVDFALDGVRIRTDRLLPEGATVDVTIDFADELPPFAARTSAAAAEPRDERMHYLLQLVDAGPAMRRSLIERALAAERRIRS